MSNQEYTIPVSLSISIPLIGNESIMKIIPPSGFNYKKVYLDEYKYKDRLTDNRGVLSLDYHFAGHGESEKSLVVLEKEDQFTFQYSYPVSSLEFINNCPLEANCAPVANQYEDELHRYFSLLHMFKEGEIARKETFYEFRTHENCISSKWLCIKNSADIVTIIQFPMEILDSEVATANALLRTAPEIYEFLKNAVFDDFEYTYHVLDDATNYKNLVTVLEVLFLHGDRGTKKEMLAKRIAVLLGKNDSEIRAIYNSVKAIYVDRSEAVHDGVTLNITRSSLDELRNILRRIYVEYVAYVQLELASNPAITFTEAKENIINLLIQQVTAKKQAGVLPQ